MALYDSIGCTYDVTRTADPFIVSRLLHHLKPSPTRLYLDVGCGSGNYTSALAKAGVNLIGADASTEMLTKARSKLPHRLLQTDAHHLSFADDTFDGAISTFVHHHFRDPQSAFWEIGRVIKRTSRFVILNATAE